MQNLPLESLDISMSRLEIALSNSFDNNDIITLVLHSAVNPWGERIYSLASMPAEEFTEDQVGEEFVFKISDKYFGEPLDCSNGLSETYYDRYTFSTIKARGTKQKVEPLQKPPEYL